MGVNYTPLDVISEDEWEYYIKMNVHDVKTRFIWDLVLIYAQLERKARFLAELSSVLHACINLILIGGDFNIIRKTLDKNRPKTTGHWSFILNVIIEQAGLRELDLHGRKYTWGNNLPNPTLKIRHDFILC